NAKVGGAGNVHAAGIGGQIDLHESAVSPEGNGEAGESTEDREGKTLDQELADDARASGAHGQADGDFLDAAGAAHKHEIGEIGAGDQQDDPGGGHQDPEGSGKLAACVGAALGAGQDVNPTFQEFVSVIF